MIFRYIQINTFLDRPPPNAKVSNNVIVADSGTENSGDDERMIVDDETDVLASTMSSTDPALDVLVVDTENEYDLEAAASDNGVDEEIDGEDIFAI